MKTNEKKQRRGFTLVELLVVIVIIAALAGLTAPMVIRQRKKADQTQAVSNARQIGLAMFEFETQYGSFPDSSTAEDVRTATETTLNLGTSTANDYFRQLIASEIVESEGIFYAKTAFSRPPDNIFNTATEALKAGEVGFGYIMNQQNAFSTAGNPARPIVAAPLAFPFSGAEFDADFYDSRAVVLKIDNSVQSLPILRSSRLAQMGGGTHLLQTGERSIWGTNVTPTMVHPEARR